ncbi:ATP-binding protein [Staphylococcus hominis]|uniref:AAA family ATPase n=1 Tax=Staphylococcus hominis TaxID=1290 RepID=UPI001F56AE4C|nr:AAA family ATPase [Staphylococcus hominis]MCI2928382.1 ATP-binding protein [Staphylococcus hominis]
MLNLHIKNIGILNEVNVDIEGLTVLGAKNDSGKSTISKVMGTSLLSINKYKDTFEDYLEEYMGSLVKSICNTIENNLRDKKFNIKEVPETIREMLDDEGEIELFSTRAKFDLSFRKSKDERVNEAIDTFRIILETFNDEITDKDFKKIKSLINDLENSKKIEIEEITNQLILEFFRETFPNNLVNFHYNENAHITIKDNDNKIFDLLFDNNENIEKCLIGNSSINNIAYIESPQIIDNLNKYEASFTERFLRKKARVKHYGNQLEKMLMTKQETNLISDNKRKNQTNLLLNKIEKIINGEMIFNENREFVFQKGSFKIDTLNVATGIKSFSIIQLLIKNNWLDEDTLLIIDEPEINLHPEWQVKYAEILVLLQKYLNVKLYINTHSSYMLEAFDLYSKKYNIQSKTNFYLLENYSSEELKEELTPIFKQLNGAFTLLDKEKINNFMNNGDLE